MRRLLALFMVAAVATAGLTGCGGGEEASPSPTETGPPVATATPTPTQAPEEIPTYMYANETIEIEVNRQFVIALDSNPTTGYGWEQRFDMSLLELAESRYEPGEEAKQGLVGAGGTDHFKFEALHEGDTEITMVYRRPWETVTGNETTLVFQVEIMAETMTYTDASQPIGVGVDDDFIIALNSNPTTGYSWQQTHDHTMLQLLEGRYEPGENARQGLVGAGGTEYFRYKALDNGETEITMVYRRPWETPTGTETTLVFEVEVVD